MTSGALDSPFLKAFTTTNTLLLGAGALYLLTFGNENLLHTGDKARKSLRPKPPLAEGIEEFTKVLSEWNRNLIVLEVLLAEEPHPTDGVDQVDAFEVGGHHNYDLTFKKLDKTLHDVVGKVSQLRQLLKTRYATFVKDQKSDIDVDQNLISSSELPLLKDDDSDLESFLSAEDEIEDHDHETLADSDRIKEKAFEAAGIHRQKALYVKGLELYFKQGIRCRRKRAKMVGCSSDMEFLAKVHCIREASKVAFANQDFQFKLETSAADLIGFLIRTAGKDHRECQKRWKALVSFCRLPENWEVMEKELSQKGVPYITFYDVVLDFIVLDAFVDLENPPYSVQATLQNRWLPTYIQQTGLETAVWGVLKAKMQMLQEPAGFLMHFYHLTEIITPVLAWGFLGSDDELTKACNIFKEQLVGYIEDVFSFQSSDYTSAESLAKDISRLAEDRYENLKPLLSQAQDNRTV